MTRTVLVLSLLVPLLARADEPGGGTADDHIARARDLHDRGDFVHARDELLAAYQLDARPPLLFALGQIELNLGHYQAAIDYYEKFIATGPAEDQATLAQQAIGAARLGLDRPPPPPPPKAAPPRRYERRWDSTDSMLVGFGSVGVAVGTGLLFAAASLDGDHSGTLRDYDSRLELARHRQLEGIAGLAAGTALAAAALVRWRFHQVEAGVELHGGGAALTLEQRW